MAACEKCRTAAVRAALVAVRIMRLEAAEQLREAADDIRGARLGWTLDDIADALGQRAEQVEAGER